MKYIVEYFYNLIINKVKKTNDDFYFKSGNNLYCLTRVSDTNHLYYALNLLQYIDNIYEISMPIRNKQGGYLTRINDNDYVLLKVNIKLNRIICLADIMSLRNILFNDVNYIKLSKFHWSELWKKKNDYFEHFINNFTESNNNLKGIMYYYINLGETAIKYLEKIEKYNIFKVDNEKLVLSHYRILKNYSLYDLFNPLNMIVDHPSRDISEYLKGCFFNEMFDDEILVNIIKKANLSDIGYMLLYARLLFPTFFFDIFSEYNSHETTKKIIELYNVTDKYELFLKKTYKAICNICFIPPIKWLTN